MRTVRPNQPIVSGGFHSPLSVARLMTHSVSTRREARGPICEHVLAMKTCSQPGSWRISATCSHHRLRKSISAAVRSRTSSPFPFGPVPKLPHHVDGFASFERMGHLFVREAPFGGAFAQMRSMLPRRTTWPMPCVICL